MEIEEVKCVNNNNWLWIIIAALLLSGGFTGGCTCDPGTSFGDNFFDNLKCGNNSWLLILALLFLFQ